jgi:hypothetical protein
VYVQLCMYDDYLGVYAEGLRVLHQLCEINDSRAQLNTLNTSPALCLSSSAQISRTPSTHEIPV